MERDWPRHGIVHGYSGDELFGAFSFIGGLRTEEMRIFAKTRDQANSHPAPLVGMSSMGRHACAH